MPFFEYFALEPLQNRELIDSGPGAAPMYQASQAYSAVGTALDSAATGTDGLIRTMTEAWPGGLSSQRAQAAFAGHNNWVRDQAMLSNQVATLADRAASLHNQALAAMPPRWEIELVMDVLAASAVVMGVSGTIASAGAGPVSAAAALVFAEASAVHAMAEAKYFELRMRAGAAMMGYEIGAVGLVLDLVGAAGSLTPPPPIAMPGSVPGPPPVPDVVGPLQDLAANGPDSPFSGPPGGGSESAGGGPESPGGGPEPGGDVGPGGEGPDPGPSGGGQQPLADPELPGPQSGDASGFDGYGTDTSTSSPLAGVSSGSSTLAALNGGAALTGFGMLRGGIGSMPGAATGFRLPTGWSPGSGTAFGAPSATSAAAPARSAARRVAAPAAQMRRRRQEEETRTGKVFTPGEQFEVPELERPPAIGVIEYQDEEPDIELSADSSLVGVLDRLDDEAEPENGFSTR